MEWAYYSLHHLTNWYVSSFNRDIDEKDPQPNGSGDQSGTLDKPTDSRPSVLGGRTGTQNMIPGRALGKTPDPALGDVPDDSPLKELEETLAIRKRVIGASHPKTLKSMRTLADQYSK